MKKGFIRFIVLFTALALAGLILTQSIWIIKAIRVGTDHFNHRANLTLEDVLDELVQYAGEKYQDTTLMVEPTHLFTVLDTNLLDTLMRKYIQYHKLDDNYGYQIVKTSTDSVLYESSRQLSLQRNENTSVHKACLSCIWSDEYYHIALFFPNQSARILWEMSTWLIISGIFLLTIIFTFVLTLLNLLKQKRVSEMKNDFINNMTHEFKTPISTIALTSEVLKSIGHENERLTKYATIIHEENHRLQNLVERVLQMAELEREKIKLNIDNIDLNRLIRNTVHNLCLEQCEKEVVIHYRLDDRNPVVEGDKLHIENMVVNLVDNASKYSGENPEITVLTRADVENNWVELEIKDNGIGIPQKLIHQIFDRFYRVPTGNVHDVRGFGIGLYYVKTMVEAHRGTIHVKSEHHKGSTFTIRMPVKHDVYKR